MAEHTHKECLTREDHEYILYGSQLSPFALKTALALALGNIPFQWHWQNGGGILDALQSEFRIFRIKSGLATLHVPREMDDLQEFPLVPFLLGKKGMNGYDSTSICRETPAWKKQGDLLDQHAPAVAFLVDLVDHFFNEWGLYLVHHKRWTHTGNNAEEPLSAGGFITRETLSFVPSSMKNIVSNYFNVRQTSRLPYLFSVAATDATTQQRPDLPPSPSPTDLYPTHDLLNASFDQTLTALEGILTTQPFLFGNVPTIADLSCFGQINMLCLRDKGSRVDMEHRFPRTVQWIDELQSFCAAYTGVPTANHLTEAREMPGVDGQLPQDVEAIRPLLSHIFQVFVPLMQQNELAYEELKRRGETVFNEAAFNRRQSMYEGKLCGHPFKHVVKTFQVHAWRGLKSRYAKLPHDVRRQLESIVGVPDLDTVFFRNGRLRILSHL